MLKFKQVQKISWSEVKETLPPDTERQILATYDEDSIILYQAYNKEIAESAVKNQQLIGAPGFSPTRMTWIKPNFLWMMYRSNWARSKNQERILAIVVPREVFENEILNNVVESSYKEYGLWSTKKEWEEAIKKSNVRLQWDPYHNPKGNKIVGVTKCIQLGLRDEFNRKLCTNIKNVNQDGVNGWIESIEDVTDFVSEQCDLLENGMDVMVPLEKHYPISNAELKGKTSIRF
ncbi:hrcA [Acrasis kona]|uniref:HrcA n=1 Tax=Acrasis kona TaxID=1008807 RepID=A0AAW2Z2M3_9EUKA